MVAVVAAATVAAAAVAAVAAAAAAAAVAVRQFQDLQIRTRGRIAEAISGQLHGRRVKDNKAY